MCLLQLRYRPTLPSRLVAEVYWGFRILENVRRISNMIDNMDLDYRKGQTPGVRDVRADPDGGNY